MIDIALLKFPLSIIKVDEVAETIDPFVSLEKRINPDLYFNVPYTPDSVPFIPIRGL